MNVESLNQKFALDDRLKVVEGKGGFPMLEIDTGAAKALISTYAGQVLSYLPAGQTEDLLFLSDSAYYAPGKAIKGGVPVCWPWFGPDPQGQGRPGHGFVRNRAWDLLGTEVVDGAAVRVRLGLRDNEETRAIWPHPFELELQATVGESLELALVTRNTGEATIDISQGLHTYFRVGDIARTEVDGLDGARYIDKMDGGAEKRQDGPVRIAGEVDRIYAGSGDALDIRDPALGRRIRIESEGSASAVVWNPWSATAAAMADLGDDDYKTLICVETTNAGPDVVKVPAGDEHRLVARYRVSGM